MDMAESIIEKQPITGLGEELDTASISTIISVVESTFKSASDYRTFSGYTSNGAEAGWYGFKHTNAKGGMAIFFSRNLGAYIISRNTSGTWSGRKLCNWGGNKAVTIPGKMLRCAA